MIDDLAPARAALAATDYPRCPGSVPPSHMSTCTLPGGHDGYCSSTRPAPPDLGDHLRTALRVADQQAARLAVEYESHDCADAVRCATEEILCGALHLDPDGDEASDIIVQEMAQKVAARIAELERVLRMAGGFLAEQAWPPRTDGRMTHDAIRGALGESWAAQVEREAGE